MSSSVIENMVSVVNGKGGAGKSTTTIALSRVFASQGVSVIVVDLDDQATTTKSLLGETVDAERSDLHSGVGSPLTTFWSIRRMRSYES